MILGIIPLIFLQIPLGSRTTILVSILLLSSLIIFFRAWKASLLIISLAAVVTISLSLTPAGLSQFKSLSHAKEQVHGEASMPSIQIRWEIFQVLSHLSLQHPLGLGPRNYAYVDLNAIRPFLKEHAKTTCKHWYKLEENSEIFNTFDFNHPNSHPHLAADPHSQYTAVIAETGVIGLILFLSIFIGLIRYTIPLLSKNSSIQNKLLGASGMLMLSVFTLSGVTVVLIYQAGSLMLFGYIATLICMQHINPKLDS